MSLTERPMVRFIRMMEMNIRTMMYITTVVAGNVTLNILSFTLYIDIVLSLNSLCIFIKVDYARSRAVIINKCFFEFKVSKIKT